MPTSAEQIAQIEREKEALSKSFQDVHFDYEYPRDLDLKPGSDFSDHILELIDDRVTASKRVTDPLKCEWKKLDWTLTAYVPQDAAEQATKAADPRKPTSIVVPMSLASLETFMTYMSSTFLGSPIHKYSGHGSAERLVNAAKMEALVARQNGWFKEGLRLQTHWQDGFTYGMGLTSPQWAKHKARRARNQVVDDVLAAVLEDLDLGIDEDDVIRLIEEETLFEGNELQSIDMYHAILDPNTTPNDIQKSEFIGWQYRTNAMELLSKEDDPEENVFNAEYVRLASENGLMTSRYWEEEESGRHTRGGMDRSAVDTTQPVSHSVDVTIMFVNLIPSEWGLGQESKPQKWAVAVAGDQIIVDLQPLRYDHGMYPVSACAPSTRGHEVVPVSYIATTYGLQEGVDWFITSHIANVRKAINDMIVFDPSYIDKGDIMNPGPGKLIRLKRNAFASGQGIDSFIKQLPVSDVTHRHVGDAQQLIQFMRETSGTVDITMGNMSGMPERPTAQGISTAQNAALSRLQRIAYIIGSQSMNDIAWQEAYNTIQFMSQETQVSILGRYERQLRSEYGLGPDANGITITPWELEPSFEIEPHNGAMPDKENGGAWTTIMQSLMAVDGVPQQLVQELGGGIVGIFKHWARINGATDLDEFKQSAQNTNVQVVPDEQVLDGIENQGNPLVPLGQADQAVA